MPGKKKQKLFIVCHTATVENNKRVKGLFLIKHNVYLLSAAESACQNFHSQIQFLCPFVCCLRQTHIIAQTAQEIAMQVKMALNL